MWRDDGRSGDFTQLFASSTVISTSYTDLQVETSLQYRYKYRVRNINGYSDFSDLGYLFAASVPAKAPTPVRVSFSSTHIELQMFAPLITGGSDVLAYELYIDQGTINSAFSKVESYGLVGGDDASLLLSTIDAVVDSLVEGNVYSFKFRSINAVGVSEFSDLVRVGLADQIQAPQNLQADLELATATSLSMKWDVVEDAQISTEGYILELL
jgi:hypothetical protein